MVYVRTTSSSGTVVILAANYVNDTSSGYESVNKLFLGEVTKSSQEDSQEEKYKENLMLGFFLAAARSLPDLAEAAVAEPARRRPRRARRCGVAASRVPARPAGRAQDKTDGSERLLT